MNCFLSELIYLSGKENGGFQFRFEKIIDKNLSIITGDRKAKISNFQFRFEKNKASIIGEYMEANNDNLDSVQIDQSYYQDDDILNSALKSNMVDSVDHDINGIDGEGPSISVRKNPFQQQPKTPRVEIAKKINYGEGVKTMRLHNGKPMDIEELKSEHSSENGEENEKDLLSQSNQNQQVKKQEEENEEDISFKEFNTTFKSRQALNAVINDRTPPSSIRNLKITANLLIISLFIIACVDYFITANEFRDIHSTFGLIDLSNKRISELQNVLSKARDLNLMQMSIYNQTYQASALLQQEIGDSLVIVEGIQQQLQLQSTTLLAAHSDLITKPVIPIKFQNSPGQIQVLNYNLDEATQQIISKAFNLQNTNASLITEQNNDYYFLQYNLFNEYYEALRSSSDYYVQELVTRSSQKGNIFLILLIVSALSLVFAMLILFPVLFKVNKTREEVLSLFLDMPEKTVKALYAKCENFISNLQIGEDEEIISELGDESFEKNNEENDMQDFHPRKKRKRFKNSGKSQRQFFLKFFIGACIIEAFFIFIYFESISLLGDIDTLIGEYNVTSMADSFYSFANNAERYSPKFFN